MSSVDATQGVACCPLQLQMMFVGMKFKLTGVKTVDVVELLPNGVMKIWCGEEEREDVWGQARANGLVLGGRTVKAIEMDVVFDRCRCCQVERLVERSRGGCAFGVCEQDANEAMHLERCPPPRIASTIRVEVIVDGSKFFQRFRRAMVAGLNEFVAVLRNRTDAKNCRMRLHVVGNVVKTAWHCTPIESASLVTDEDVECELERSAAGSTGRPFFDGLGKVLDLLTVDQARIVCVFTDGQDTSSQTYSRAKIAHIVRKHKQAGWTYLYLSLYNSDANFTGESTGFSTDTCATLRATSAGVRSALTLAALATTRAASGQQPAFLDEDRNAAFQGLLSATIADGATKFETPPSLPTAGIELVIDGSTMTKELRHVAVNCLNNLIEALRARLPESVPIQLHTFGKLVKARWQDGTLLADAPRIVVDDLPSFTSSDKSALLDALAITLSRSSSSSITKDAADAARIVLILTQGRDTASHLYTTDDVRSLIDARRKNGWVFVWLSSEGPQDNATGPGLGIDPTTCTSFRDRCPGALRASFLRATSSIVRAASGGSPAFATSDEVIEES